VEIVSDSDASDAGLQEKLGRYRRLGVCELVRFDPEGTAATRPRVWDRVEGDLIEREVQEERTPSLLLPLVWVVAPAEGHGAALRILHPESQELVPTRAEAREAAQAALERESEARRAAQARIAELEAELRRRG